MSKRRKHKTDFGKGWRAGYSEYRYGTSKPITLANVMRPAPIFRGEKKKHVIQQTMDAMRDWRMSPFEEEGTMIAGLRSGLCLDGYGWSRSDQQAREIVSEALRLLGAKRPTWEQGQPDYVEPHENCKVCGGPLDEEALSYRDRFCSAECARIAMEKRTFWQTSRDSALYRRAVQLVRISRKPVRECQQCGKSFRQRGENGQAKFCSSDCYADHKRERAPSFKSNCAFCWTPFTSKQPAMFCSPTCKTQAHRVQSGRIKRLSPPVFDYVFAMAA
ncbi:hypothetical protein GTW25_05920 [Aliihoeflea aestuarii]|jgi:predicted nucleic acid-binding Zn ribbon protein|uniref:hypothetical protein n=1 Tax=Aliihoeflea aestuarii TaxID=453840 RepID=UPI00209259AA|nr:hypothetical protein [Aliihoeflea aestuarii]MCO6390563.1 hypothetical protein [Aliihoeflea aestuarii]